MANEFNIDYSAFHPADLTKRWRESKAAREQARLTEKYERHLKTVLHMPMYKNLPTGGFKYDWKQFRNFDGLFVIRIKGSDQSKHTINNHVKHFSHEEMDAFCAAVFDKATELLENLSSSGTEDFWAKVARELGIQTAEGRIHIRAFWDWAMKLVAARIVYRQEQIQDELQVLSAPDTAGDVDMSDQPNECESDLNSHSLAAEAVEKFLAVGISKYCKIPKKFGAISRHHTFVAPSKTRRKKPSKKDSNLARKPPRHAQVQNSFLPVKATPTTDNPIRVRRSAFGSHVDAGEPAWWGSISQPQIPTETSRSQWTPTELQEQKGTAQGSSGQGGAVDDLVIGMYGTTIEDGPKAPQLLTNLAVRTVNPLKRRHDDVEETNDGAKGNQPLVKMAKLSDGRADTSVP